jgi:hypothetical protein
VRNIIIDGMLSGTGIRDADGGGFLNLTELGLDVSTTQEIQQWVEKYANANYSNYSNKTECAQLDLEGVTLAKKIQKHFGGVKVKYYYSAANMERTFIE